MARDVHLDLMTALAMGIVSAVIGALTCLCFLLIFMSKTLAVTTAESYSLFFVMVVCGLMVKGFEHLSKINVRITREALVL
jgi:hypothetical protein